MFNRINRIKGVKGNSTMINRAESYRISCEEDVYIYISGA
jgi:hypothetical protein